MSRHLQGDYPLHVLCDVLDLARSSYYYAPQGDRQQSIVAEVEQVLARYPSYGYRRVRAQLARQGIQVGERGVRRVLQQLGGSRNVGQVRVQTPDSGHAHGRYPNRLKGLTITQVDQVWVADISYIRVGKRFLYFAFILDAYTRAVRGWHLSRSLSQALTLTALEQA
jgi:transposase InsO family protein